MFWIVIAILAIAVVAAIALGPKPPQAPDPALDEIDIPSADEGKPIPVVFGTMVVKSPNVVWYGDISYEPVKVSGGK